MPIRDDIESYMVRSRFAMADRRTALRNYRALLTAGFSSFDAVPWWATVNINGVRVFANCFRIHGMVLLLWKDPAQASKEIAAHVLDTCTPEGLKAFFPYDNCGANPEWAKDVAVPS